MLSIKKVPYFEKNNITKDEATELIFNSPFFRYSPERKKRKENLMESLVSILEDKQFLMKNLEKIIREKYPIQTWLNNPILRTKSKEVENIKDPEIQKFADILLVAMKMYDWIGLAAPQIGENIRMIAVCQLDKKEKNIILTEVMINPEIIERKWEYICEEWCLSLPWLEWKVKRSKYVKVKYTTPEWEEKIIEAKNLNAAILQHEIDHLDWILFWDKVINKQPQININKLVQF